MKKVLCIGHAAYDITIPVTGFPVENTKNRINERIECGGGPASNAAYLLGKWGLETYFSGIIGNDNYGKVIKKEFESVNVNTEYLQIENNTTTTSSFILANLENGTRTIFTYRPKNYEIKLFDYKVKPDFILVDGQEYDLSVKAINDFPDAVSVLDAGSVKESTVNLAKIVDYVVCSHDFAEQYTNIKMDLENKKTIINVFDILNKNFKGKLIITFEEKGALYLLDNKIVLIPSIKTVPRDTTGAGDIFHGAFVYFLSQNLPLNEVIKKSNIAGALSVSKIGGRNSVPNLSEVENCYNE